MRQASGSDPCLTRRHLIHLATGAGAAAALPLAACTTSPRGEPADTPFTLGVASGDPWPDGVVLWTRLAPDPLNGGGMEMKPVPVTWEVSADPGMKTMVRKGDAVARPELGHSVHVEVDGLAPDREYWYRFSSGNAASQIGRTKTAPAIGADTDRLRFAFCGCQHYETGYYTAFRHLANENVDFVFHTGDYIYEYGPGGRGRRQRVRLHTSGEVYTLAEYRNRYALYKSDPDLIAAHASAPFIVSWDDHEVDNNWAASADQDGTPAKVFAMRRAAAFQAYYEHMPLRRSSLPRGTRLQLYRRLRFGGLVDFNVLDTRQFRSDQSCGDRWQADCADTLDPSRTMLGTAQERWLADGLAGASARWTVLAQQVPSYRLLSTRGGGRRLNMDKWDGYPAARRRLYAALVESRASNPVVLSGDIHAHMAADLRLDFEDPASRRVGVEFTNSSISSGGDGTDQWNGWERVAAANPHLKYNSNRRGYVVCDVSRERWLTEFKVVDKVTERGAPLRTAHRVVVEDRDPSLKLA